MYHFFVFYSLTSICTKDQVLDGLQQLKMAEQECHYLMPCKYSRYQSSFFRNDKNYNPFLNITIDSNIAEVDSAVGYKIANYIGELGGTMGLFLGWSFLFILENLIGVITRDNKKAMSVLKYILTCSLWLISMYWCKDIFDSYTNEVESMQFHYEQNVTSPDVTICYSNFGSILRNIYPCLEEDGGLEFDFQEAIVKCLKNDVSSSIMTDLASMEYHDIGIPFLKSLVLFSIQGEKKVLGTHLMKKVFHKKYGICYSFPGRYWHR